MLDNFKIWLEGKGCEQKTSRKYQNVIHELTIWFTATKGLAFYPEQITAVHIHEFISFSNNNQWYEPNFLSGLNNYFNFLIEANLVTKNPMLDINYYKLIMEEIKLSPIVDMRIIKKIFLDILEKFYPYKDSHFDKEMQNGDYNKFHQRFFEAYMGYFFINNGLNIKSNNEGPDFIIEDKIYIECVAPNSGKDENEVKIITEKVSYVPEEKIQLRLVSVIEEKFLKYKNWCMKKIIDNNKPYIIAINGNLIPFVTMNDDYDIPRIVKILFGKGSLAFNWQTEEVFLSTKDKLVKDNGSPVKIGHFINEKYKNISGIIFSKIGFMDLDKPIENDLILVKNPYAKNSIDKIEIDLKIQNENIFSS